MATQPDHGALSLEQIEQDRWGDAPVDATRLVRTAHELRRKAIALLTGEDLRLLIGQQVSIDVLVPRALALLADDPLIEGDFYPGDLLVAVMKLPLAYWQNHSDQTATLSQIAGSVESLDADLRNDIEQFLATVQ
jgi:hypothetical protein